MKQYVISYLNFPVTDISSYGYVKAINKSEGNEFDLRLTNDPKVAQKFGAEAGEVAGWLANMTDANMAFRVLEFEERVVEPQPTTGLLVIDQATYNVIGSTVEPMPGATSVEYYLGMDITDPTKRIDVKHHTNELQAGDLVTQVHLVDVQVIGVNHLLIRFN